MISLHPQFITDNTGTKISVILPVNEFNELMEELEDIEDVRLYDEAMNNDTGERISISDAFNRIEESRKNKS